MYQDIIGLEEQAIIRARELRRDRDRFTAEQDLGLLSLVARIFGRIASAAHRVENWATRPAIIDTSRSHRWHNS